MIDTVRGRTFLINQVLAIKREILKLSRMANPGDEALNGAGKSQAEKDPPALVEKREEFTQQDGLLRDNMVDLAVRFLTNSRVQTSPMEQRRAFLKKKGMHLLRRCLG